MIRKNLSLLKLIIIATLVGLALIYISGCSKAEIQKVQSEKEGLISENKALKDENEALKSKIASLEQEISKLKETAEFHYQQGVDLQKESKYEEAKAAFEAVIEKYPASSLVSSAKQRLETVNREIKRLEAEKVAEEKRRKEEEQYQPKSEDEAIAEWENFRREPDRYKGTVTTWRFMVRGNYENFQGYLDWGKKGTYVCKCGVEVTGPDKGTEKYLSYKELSILGKFPVVHEDDYVVVTGKFIGVSSSGYIVLSEYA
jgi:tetratricopeptide (TPR) repeat protein